MTATAPKFQTSPLWRPPLPTTRYRRDHDLMSAERAAIASYLQLRSMPRRRRAALRNLREASPLKPLLHPIKDALDLMGSKPSDRNGTISVL